MPTPETAQARQVRVDQIVPDPHQPRRSISPEDIADLVLSIRSHGVINPVLLSPHPDPAAWDATPFMLVCGERRWAAARAAGLRSVPATVDEDLVTPADRLMVQLEENDGELRRELPLSDRVDAIVRAFRLSGLRKEEFATAHGKTTAWLSHYFTLANADGITRLALEEGHLTGMTTAHLFRRLGGADRLGLLERARRNRLPITDRLVEAAAQRREREAESAIAEPSPATPHRLPGSLQSTPPARGDSRTIAPQRPPGELAAGAVAAMAPGAVDLREETAERFAEGERIPVLALNDPNDSGDRHAITFTVSLHQLETLIVLLGRKPGPTPEEQIRQLRSFLH